MLEAGYTTVCEFHYLHHDADGRPYADDADAGAGAAARRAARRHRPHAAAGALPDQRLRRAAAAARASAASSARPIRCCACCERAEADLRGAGRAPGPGAAFAARRAARRRCAKRWRASTRSTPTAPIHIHIAEQTKEVDDCIAWSGQRPVAWLLDHAPVDARWCLVHATHMDAGEYRARRRQRRRRRPVPDHRGQPRRRHLRPAGLARGRRRLGHRLRQPCLRQRGRGTAAARIQPAPGHARSATSRAEPAQPHVATAHDAGGGAGRRAGRGPRHRRPRGRAAGRLRGARRRASGAGTAWRRPTCCRRMCSPATAAARSMRCGRRASRASPRAAMLLHDSAAAGFVAARSQLLQAQP